MKECTSWNDCNWDDAPGVFPSRSLHLPKFDGFSKAWLRTSDSLLASSSAYQPQQPQGNCAKGSILPWPLHSRTILPLIGNAFAQTSNTKQIQCNACTQQEAYGHSQCVQPECDTCNESKVPRKNPAALLAHSASSRCGVIPLGSRGEYHLSLSVQPCVQAP